MDVVKQLVAEFRRCGRKFRSSAWMVQAGWSVAMPLIGMYVNLLFYFKNSQIFITSKELCLPVGEEKRQRVYSLAVPAHHFIAWNAVQGTAQAWGAVPQVRAYVHLEEKLEKINNQEVVCILILYDYLAHFTLESHFNVVPNVGREMTIRCPTW